MRLTVTCKHCGEVLRADDEDDLVAQVQAHRRSHDHGPALSRDHILARLRRANDNLKLPAELRLASNASAG